MQIQSILLQEYMINLERGGGKIVFTGSLKRGYVDAQYAIDVFSSDLFSNCSIEFYSAGNGVDAVTKAGSNISLKGWVSKKELDIVYGNADAFLSIAEKSGKQISSKIFEYMSCNKPIIHVYYVDYDVNIKYLQHYPKALCIKASLHNIEHNRLMIMFFLLCMRYRKDSYTIDAELQKCTPASIACDIETRIS